MNLGVALAATGNLPEAINQYRKSHRDLAVLRDSLRQPGSFTGIIEQPVGGHARVREGYLSRSEMCGCVQLLGRGFEEARLHRAGH